MRIYTLLMESFYYDGDDLVIDDVATELRNFDSFDKAKECMEAAIAEELSECYTEDMLTRDGEGYAVFKENMGFESDRDRTLYRLTIYGRELNKDTD